METHAILSTNTILLFIIAVSGIITTINIFRVAKNLEGRELLQNGIALLLDKEYKSAIEKFDQLALKPISNNKGLYYKAYTLLTRNENTDKAEAIELMKQIVEQGLGCKEYAKKFV